MKINNTNLERKKLFDYNLRRETFPAKDTGAAIVTFETVAMRDMVMNQMTKKNSRSVLMDYKTMKVEVPGNPVQINWRSLQPGYPFSKKKKKRYKYQAKSYGYILLRKRTFQSQF